MKKFFNRKNETESIPVESDIAGLISKVQQQLFSLEKKVDILINQSSDRSSERKSFSRPFKRFDRDNRRDNRFEKGRKRENSNDGSFSKAICAECKKECKVPFKPRDNRPIYCSDCFSKRKDDNR